MRVAFITARPRDDWETRSLEGALQRRWGRAAVHRIAPQSLVARCGGDPGHDPVLHLEVEGRSILDTSVVLLGDLGSGDGIDIDIAVTQIRMVELAGIPVINRVDAMLVAQDKLRTAAVLAAAGLPTPPCAGVAHPALAESVLRQVDARPTLHLRVVKPLFGSLGEGLWRCGVDEANRLAEASRDAPLLVQRWIQTGGMDYRLFVVGDRVEACMRRLAAPDDWRTNVGRGARVEPVEVPAAWREVAIAAAAALGLDVAGVDIATDSPGREGASATGRPWVLEVNGLPHFRGIWRATGRNMAPRIAAWLAHRIGEGSRRRSRRIPSLPPPLHLMPPIVHFAADSVRPASWRPLAVAPGGAVPTHNTRRPGSKRGAGSTSPPRRTGRAGSAESPPARGTKRVAATTARLARVAPLEADVGAMSVREAGRKGGLIGGKKGGETIKAQRGVEFFREIGRKGGQRVRDLVAAGRAAAAAAEQEQTTPTRRRRRPPQATAGTASDTPARGAGTGTTRSPRRRTTTTRRSRGRRTVHKV